MFGQVGFRALHSSGIVLVVVAVPFLCGGRSDPDVNTLYSKLSADVKQVLDRYSLQGRELRQSLRQVLRWLSDVSAAG